MRKIPTKHQFVAIYKHEDEYIVKVPENSAADYYTGDWQDALDTANHMDEFLRAKAGPLPNRDLSALKFGRFAENPSQI